MVISALKQKLMGGPKIEGPKAEGLNETADTPSTTKSQTAPLSKTAENPATKLSSRENLRQKLDIKPHTPITDTKALDKSAQKILGFYKFDSKNTATTSSEDKQTDFPTQAHMSQDGKEMLVEVSPTVSAQILTKTGFMSAIANKFRSQKTNEVLSRLKANQVVDLGNSQDHEGINPKLMQELVKAGVVSFVAIHTADEKGKFTAAPDLIIPKMNLSKMLDYLNAKPPMKGEALTYFQAKIKELKADSKLDNIIFIDEVLTSAKTNEKFQDKAKLAQSLQCACDTLSNKEEIFVSGNLVGKGPEGFANGKEYQAIDYKKVSVDAKGEISTPLEPMTIVRAEERKDEALPVEHINTVLSWHRMIQVADPDKINHSKDALKLLDAAFNFNAGSLKDFDASLKPTASLKKDDKTGKNNENTVTQAA